MKDFKIGVPPLLLLTLFFITLKVSNVISWSWLWVLSPLWFPWFVVLSFIMCWLVFMFFVGIILFLISVTKGEI